MDGMNVVAVWDYRNLFAEGLALEAWSHVDVVAWSMGVWAAERFVVSHPEVKWGAKVALCGSPRPVDDEYGIPLSIVRGTADGWNERNRRKFNMRMFGGGSAMEQLGDRLSVRPLDEQKEELLSIMEAQNVASGGSRDEIQWTKAYLGEDDMIFGKDNLLRFWNEGAAAEVEVRRMPHYPFAELRDLKAIVGSAEGEIG